MLLTLTAAFWLSIHAGHQSSLAPIEKEHFFSIFADNKKYFESFKFIISNIFRFPDQVIILKGIVPCEPVRTEQTLDLLLGAIIGNAIGLNVGTALEAGVANIISAGSGLPSRNGIRDRP